MALLPPGGLPEIVFSFDTTGSMSSCLTQVRGRIQDMIQRLQADIPAIRIAVFAHGDYCDKHNYVTKWIDFSTDVKKLCNFVNNVKSTGGGDSDECYELVLRQVGEELSWTPGSNRALVMIGDANPHGPDYPDNTLKIDWKEEIVTLAKMGVKIYGTQVGGGSTFYKTISEATGGRHLKLDSFSNVFDFLMAICYREHGAEMLDVYEAEVRARCGVGPLSTDMEGMFTTLRDGGAAPKSPAKKPLTGAAKKPLTKKAKKASTLEKAKADLRAGKGKLKSVRKIRKPTTKKLTKKSTKLVLPLLRREEVPETNFMLKDKNWSLWTKVVSPEIPENQDSDLWEKRRGDGNGFKVKKIFAKNNRPALYEISVQNCRYGRRFVVFQKFCRNIPDNVSWERRLLGNAAVRAQVNEVVSQGCSVYVRRVVYGTARSHMTSVVPSLKSYDYAWRRQRSTRPHARLVIKQGTTISSDKW